MEVFCYVVADVWNLMYIDTFFSVLRWGDSPRKPSRTWMCHMSSGRVEASVEADSEELAWKWAKSQLLELLKHAEDVCGVKLGLGSHWREKKCIDIRGNNRFSVYLFISHRPPRTAWNDFPFRQTWIGSTVSKQFDETILISSLPVPTPGSGRNTCPVFSAFDLDLIAFSSDFFFSCEILKNWNSHTTQRCCEHAVCEQTVTIVQYIVGNEVVLCPLVKLMGTKIPNQQ